MIYNLKKDNYKTFNVFKDNILDPRSYFIPFANENEMLESDIRTERYASSMVAVLSGEWEFKYCFGNKQGAKAHTRRKCHQRKIQQNETK